MQALINNYSAFSGGSSLTASSYKSYCIADRKQPSASVVLTDPNEVNLNTKIFLLLNEYSKLLENWDNEGALAPSSIAINNAKIITNILSKHAQPIFHAAPGPNGEIMLDIRNKSKNRSIEIIFYQDKTIAAIFPDDGPAKQTAFDIDNLPDLLQELHQK